jgi:hypothetical protein
MIKLLIQLKKRLPFIWHFVEYINGVLFKSFFEARIRKNADVILKEFKNEEFSYRFLNVDDLISLHDLFVKQNQEQFRYFKPHDFDLATIKRLYKNPAFLMLGVFDNQRMVGYFFLRCFLNKKSFTGRIVDEQYQGKGIAKRMGKILHKTAWLSNFRVFGTASRDNFKSISSYKSINNFKIIKELDNNYIYFEYLQTEEKPIQ